MKKLCVFIASLAVMLSAGASAAESRFFGMEASNEVTGLHELTNPVFENGTFYAEAETNDPFFTLPVDFDANDYPVIYMRMRASAAPRADNASLYAQIFFRGTAADGSTISYAGVNSTTAALCETMDEDYRLYAFDFSGCTNFKDAHITSLRVDPINSTGYFDIDYILMTGKDADLLYTFDGDANGFVASNLSDAGAVGGAYHGKTKKTNSLIYNAGLDFAGGDYPTIIARAKFSGLTDGGSSLLYTNLVDENGAEIKAWSAKYAGEPDKCARVSIKQDTSSDYYNYTYSFAAFPGYLANRVTKIYYNVVSSEGITFDIDYLRFHHAVEDYRFDFDTDGYFEGLKPSDSTRFTVSDGALHYVCGDSYNNPRLSLSCDGLIADNYTKLEAVIRYPEDTVISSPYLQMYFAGTDAAGNAFSLSESAAVRAYTEVAGGGRYAFYTVDLADNAKWEGATITSLRFDILKGANTDFDVDYLRLVSSTVTSGAYDDEDLAFDVDFADDTTDKACGTYTVSFGDKGAAFARIVTLFWQSGNETDGYEDLDGYTAITALSGADAAAGYRITKEMLIPAGVTAVAAYVKDSEGTHKLVCPVPAGKQTAAYGTPLHRVAMITDNHFGYGNVTSIRSHDLAVLDEIEDFGADFVLDAGDFTQWYGTIEKDYTWDLAEAYFKRFSMPVFITNGNHDVPAQGIIDSPQYGEPAGFTFDTTENGGYYERFLDMWLQYNASEGIYTVNRPQGVNWYDAEYDGYHIIMLAVPRWENGGQSSCVGEAQLAWLEERLNAAEGSGRPVFVVSHVALNQTVGNLAIASASYYEDADKVRAVLDKHPSAVFVSGHSHLTLDGDFTTTVNGKGTSPSFIHAGGANDIYTYPSLTSTVGTTAANVAQGVICDIYEDRMIVRGRDFTSHKWISRGLYEITLPAPAVPTLTVDDTSVTVSGLRKEASLIVASYQSGRLTAVKIQTVGADTTLSLGERGMTGDVKAFLLDKESMKPLA